MLRILFCAVLAVAACGNDRKPLCGTDFASAETYRGCHGEIYQQWRSSYHSRASSDSLFWRVFQKATEEPGSRASLLCLTCHAPVATVGREIVWFRAGIDQQRRVD